MQITKQIHWHMAHRLLGYDGPCGHLHGHTYRVQAVIDGPLDPGLDMVIDFSHLSRLMRETVDGLLDHATLLSAGDPLVEPLLPYTNRLVLISHNTSAEVIAQVLYNIWSPALLSMSAHVLLSEVRVWETETSSAAANAYVDGCKILWASKWGLPFERCGQIPQSSSWKRPV